MQPIICRLNPRFWVIVVLSFLVSLALIFGPSRETDPPERRTTIVAALITGIFGLVTTAYLAADLARGEVRADDTGLQWRRGFRARRSARWEEISDFYVRLTANGTHFIETPVGKLGVDKSFVGIDEILALLPQRAVHARARDWEERDYRSDENWEQTLPVWTKSQKWAAPLWTAAAFYLIGYFGYAMLFGPKKLMLSPDFGWFDVLGAVFFVLIFGALGMISVVPAIISWRERKFAWAHRDESLRINARGLIFASDEKRVEAAWDEVQSVERTKNQGSFKGYRVTTKNGEFVHWANNSLFRVRCESYAPAALESLRREEAQLSLDSELKPAPIASDGTQKFSFRTPGNRLILLCAFSALGFAPFIYLISVYNKAVDEPFAPSWLLFGVMCAFAILVSGALWLWFARAFIVVGAEDLQLHWPLRAVRRVRFADIENAGADAWGNWIRAGGRKIYWSLGLFPARRAELSALIEERVRAKF